MSHPPFPRGATARENEVVQHLHQVAHRHKEPEVRQAISGAVELIVELIGERGRRREFEDQVEDAGAERLTTGLIDAKAIKPAPNDGRVWSAFTAGDLRIHTMEMIAVDPMG